MYTQKVITKLCLTKFVRLVIFSLALFAAPTSFAQAKITPCETTLKFRGPHNLPLKRTFCVEGKSLDKLTVVKHDLIGTKTGGVILSSSITVTPADDETGNRKYFGVTIDEAATQPDHYTGALKLRVKGEAAPVATIALEVDFEPVPAVEAEAAARSITVAVQQPCSDIPYWGRPKVDIAQQTLMEQAIHLVQPSNSDAEIETARILAMKGTNGEMLPVNAVRVKSSLPLRVTGISPQPLQIAVAGENFAAGKYDGTLYIRVHNQPQAVQIPITVTIKHGWPAALFVLVFGLAAAYLFSWWKDEGKGQYDLIKPIENLAKNIRDGGNLQADERTEAVNLLKQALDALNAAAPSTEVKEKFEAAANYVKEKRNAAKTFLNETLAPQLQKVQNLEPGRIIRKRFVAKLGEIKLGVEKGEYKTLSDAQAALNELIPKIDYFGELVALLRAAEIPQDKKDAAMKAFDEAESDVRLLEILKNAGVEPKRPRGRISLGVPEKESRADSDADHFELSKKRWFQLYVGRLAVMAIAYVFVVLVGFITIYVKEATFGADPAQYVYLFLWGSTVESVRGQTFDLKSLHDKLTEKPAGV